MNEQSFNIIIIIDLIDFMHDRTRLSQLTNKKLFDNFEYRFRAYGLAPLPASTSPSFFKLYSIGPRPRYIVYNICYIVLYLLFVICFNLLRVSVVFYRIKNASFM